MAEAALFSIWTPVGPRVRWIGRRQLRSDEATPREHSSCWGEDRERCLADRLCSEATGCQQQSPRFV